MLQIKLLQELRAFFLIIVLEISIKSICITGYKVQANNDFTVSLILNSSQKNVLQYQHIFFWSPGPNNKAITTK